MSTRQNLGFRLIEQRRRRSVVAPTTADHLAFTTQPSGNTSGSALGTQPVVAAKKADNSTDTAYAGSVVISLNVVSGSPVLSGTTTKALSSGVATFTDLVVTGAGDWTLTATLAPLTAATSTQQTTSAAPTSAFALAFSGANARLYASASNAAVLAASTLIVGKIRFRGDLVTTLSASGQFTGPTLCCIGSSAGGSQKFAVNALDKNSTQVRFNAGGYIDATNGSAVFVDIARSSFTAGAWYTVYFQVAKSASPGSAVAVYDDAGTLLGQTTAGPSLGADFVAGGFVAVGEAGAAAMTGAIDGLALYNTTLAGAAQHSKPTAGDSGLIQLTYFDDGAGNVAVATVGADLDTKVGTLTWVDNSADANRWSA